MHRTTAEWLAHPEGAHLAGTDLIEIRKVADGDPVAWTPDPMQPLSGIKALALTHVIAGSTAARTLSEYGAEVLHIMRDQSFEHEAIWTDVNVGMRSANLDLNRPDQNAALAALVPTPTSSSTASAAAASSGWASASRRSRASGRASST